MILAMDFIVIVSALTRVLTPTRVSIFSLKQCEFQWLLSEIMPYTTAIGHLHKHVVLKLASNRLPDKRTLIRLRPNPGGGPTWITWGNPD